MENSIITIGKDKNGEWDFGVRATVQNLSPKEMDELRSMTITAIYTAEDMWRRSPNMICLQQGTKEDKG